MPPTCRPPSPTPSTWRARPPRGPVVLSLPLDVQVAPAPPPHVATAVPAPHGPPADAMDRAAALLGAARAPAILAGDEVRGAVASAALVALAERLAAPILGEPMAASVPLPTDHPLWRGPLPPFAAQIRPVLEGHDVVLAVGMPVFRLFGTSPGPALPDGVTLIHLDVDAHEVGKNLAHRGRAGGRHRRGARWAWPRASGDPPPDVAARRVGRRRRDRAPAPRGPRSARRRGGRRGTRGHGGRVRARGRGGARAARPGGGRGAHLRTRPARRRLAAHAGDLARASRQRPRLGPPGRRGRQAGRSPPPRDGPPGRRQSAVRGLGAVDRGARGPRRGPRGGRQRGLRDPARGARGPDRPARGRLAGHRSGHPAHRHRGDLPRVRRVRRARRRGGRSARGAWPISGAAPTTAPRCWWSRSGGTRPPSAIRSSSPPGAG